MLGIAETEQGALPGHGDAFNPVVNAPSVYAVTGSPVVQ
jgi:hypothetical protein